METGEEALNRGVTILCTTETGERRGAIRFESDIHVAVYRATQNRDLDTIRKIIRQIRPLLGSRQIMLSAQKPNLEILFLDAEDFDRLAGADAARAFGAFRLRLRGDGEIESARVYIRAAIPNGPVRDGVIREELVQSLGAAGEFSLPADSVFTDAEPGPRRVLEEDRWILETLYSDCIAPGAPEDQVRDCLRRSWHRRGRR